MKNKSWRYPFPTLEDERFDMNKDGELDSFETTFRDMHLDEINQKLDKDFKEYLESKKYKPQKTLVYLPE